MSFRFDTPLVTSGFHLGNRGLGVLGSSIPSSGDNGPSYMYNDLSLPEDSNKEYRGVIVTPPSSGTFFAYEDGSFSYSGASNSFVYRLYEDGVDRGTGTVTLSMSDTPVVVIGWSEQNDVSSVTASLKTSLTLGWSEADDDAAISTNVMSNSDTLILNWSEVNDLHSVIVNANLVNSVVWTEADDVISIAGSVASSNVSATAAWTETNDIHLISVGTPISISAAWTEANDSSFITVFVPGAAQPLPANIQVKFKSNRYKITFRRG